MMKQHFCLQSDAIKVQKGNSLGWCPLAIYRIYVLNGLLHHFGRYGFMA